MIACTFEWSVSVLIVLEMQFDHLHLSVPCIFGFHMYQVMGPVNDLGNLKWQGNIFDHN